MNPSFVGALSKFNDAWTEEHLETYSESLIRRVVGCDREGRFSDKGEVDVNTQLLEIEQDDRFLH